MLGFRRTIKLKASVATNEGFDLEDFFNRRDLTRKQLYY